ncbi:O-antigen ligase family protein [Streptomyces smaragdinus]|uniref:O-antigen ligase family protein n=1 Tax=Streptomyces smaragdinus TaxID=2585196 RepID=UPI001E61A135|nr:O-antigen ligase family protein [Streptomyces smaragdinus]
MIRRWYVAAPVALLGVLAAFQLYRTVPLDYESQSSVSLLNSRAAARVAPSYGNPIADAGGSLIGTAEVLIRTIESQDSAKTLRDMGVTDPYTVGFAEKAEGPLLTLTVTGSDRADVYRETEIITRFAAEELQALQSAARVPEGYYAQATPIVSPQQPVSEAKPRYQAAAAVVLAAGAAGFVLAFVAEAIGRFRSGRPLRRPSGRGGVLLGRELDATDVLSVYLALALFIPSNLALPGLGGVGTPANAFALVGLCWYLAGWLSGRLVPVGGSRAPTIAVGVLTLAVLLSFVANATRGAAGEEISGADRAVILLVVWVTLVVLGATAMRDRERLDVLLRRLVVMAAVVAALGIYDFVTETSIADLIAVPGLQTSVAGASVMDRGSFTRPRSLTAHPLEFGGMLAVLLPFAVQQAFDPVRRGASAARRWGPVVLLGGLLPLTVSRTSIIGAAVVALVMVPRWKPGRRWAAIGVLVGAVGVFKVIVPGLIGTITGLFSEFLSNSDSSTQARTVKYSEIAVYFRQDPVLGRGFGTFFPDRYFFTDNEYLLVLAEMGVVGLVALAGLFLAGIHCGGAIRRVARDDNDRELGQAFFASAMVSLVISATFDSLSFPMFAGVFFVLLGAAGGCLGFVRRSAAASSRGMTPEPPAGKQDDRADIVRRA